jgi:hypothetical protein
MEPIPPTPESQTTEPPAPATPKAFGAVGKLMNVFAAPGEVFGEIKTAPPRTANWLTPALLLIVLSWVSGWLIFSQPAIQQQIRDITNKAIDRQVEAGKLNGAQADQARTAAEKFGSIGYKIGAVVGPVFMAFATPFWGGLILWLVGSFALKAPFPYLKAVEIAGLANMILVLDVIVRTLLVLITGNLFAALSLMLAVKDFDPQNTFHSVLALVNVMTFWLLTIRSIGLARFTGAPVVKAAAWVFGIWIVLMGLIIGFGAAMRAAFGG